MQPKVLLIDPPDFQNADKRNLQLPLGLIALHNYVTQQDLVCEAKIVDLSLSYLQSKNNNKAPISLLKNSGIVDDHWDIIGITTHYTNTLTSIAIAKYLKKICPKALIVFGGIHATSCHTSLLEKFTFIDLVICGEGELGLAALCKEWSGTGRDAIVFSKIPNSAYRDASGSVVTASHRYLSLEEIGSYEFSCIDLQSYVDLSQVDAFWLESGRGCVFKCGFCISAKHWGHRSRYFSALKIVEDVLSLKKAGIRKIKFTHDQFSCNKRRVTEICNAMLDKKVEVEWGCYSRVSEFPFEELDLMAKSGCRRIFVGVESKNASIQESIKKAIPANRLRTIMESCQRKGIELETNIIFGFPEQDEEQILSEIAFCAALQKENFGRVSISPLELYPSTSFYDDYEYRSLFYLRSPKQREFEELYSFQFEFRKKFWGLPMKILAECARVWTTYFPATTVEILRDPNGRQQFTQWLCDNRKELCNIHEGENLNHFTDFLNLITSVWGAGPKIADLLVVEMATALVAAEGTVSYFWESDEGPSIRYMGQEAWIKTRAYWNGEGKLYRSETSNYFNQMSIHGSRERLIINDHLAA